MVRSSAESRQDQADELQAVEAVIEAGLRSFYVVGTALAHIRDNRLYHPAYTSFDRYCTERWEMRSQSANRMIAAAATIVHLEPIGSTLPTSEHQVRSITQLDPDDQRAVWQEAVETAPNGKVTGAHVARIVRAMAGHDPDDSSMDVHYSSATPEWYTPSHIIDHIVEFFDEIDLDPCSNSKTNPNVPALAVYTESDDGLMQPWFGRVYCNPPYGSGIGRWIDKARNEYEASLNRPDEDEPEMFVVESVIMLLPARVGSKWFRALRDYAVCFLHGRLTFVGADTSSPFPSMMVYLGDEVDRFARVMQPIGDVWIRRK